MAAVSQHSGTDSEFLHSSQKIKCFHRVLNTLAHRKQRESMVRFMFFKELTDSKSKLCNINDIFVVLHVTR